MPIIVQKDNPILRQTAHDVPVGKITSPEIKKIIKDMKKALLSQDDGVAIAAPQIGKPLRIFVMSGRVIDLLNGKDVAEPSHPDTVYINPRITKRSKEKQTVEEGCLSVRWLYGKVERAKKATVVAYDEEGKKFTKGGSNLIAQIFQHEVDHLDGVLFIDKAFDVVDIPPEEVERLKKNNPK